MCGFIVLAGKLGPDIGEPLEKATSLIRHRGPDDEGYVFIHSQPFSTVYEGGADTAVSCFHESLPFLPKAKIQKPQDFTPDVVMGHRRLAILDLSHAGHQPMATLDGRFVLVYNGEIYNHAEIRKELERAGYSFFSHSDTEVLLYAYQEWGSGCLKHFNGMFSFVIYDSRSQSLFAARDRFGVKPFYYWKSPAGFYAFASEIKQFTVLPGWKAVLNNNRGFDFLKFGWLDHTQETLFKDVYQLRGGECGEVLLKEENPCFVVKQWYEFKPVRHRSSFEDATEEFRHLLADAVQLRLRADVPIGTCLSGGLDSSSVVCLADQFLREKDNSQQQMTYSARSTYPQYDEKFFMDAVIQRTKVTPHFCYPEAEQLFQELDLLTWHQDEPFGSTSIYAQWCVFKTVHTTDVRVILDGYGADESLAGYFNFRPYFSYLFTHLKWKRLSNEIREARRRHSAIFTRSIPREWMSIAKYALVPQPECKEKQSPAWLSKTFFSSADSLIGQKLFFKKRTSRNLSTVVSDSFLYTPMPEQLHWADRNSMAHSIEQRCPFMDYRVVEFLKECPDEYKIRGGQTKAILRKAMQGILPETIRQRDSKLGFATAEEQWMKKEHPERFKQLVQSAVESSQGVLTSGAVELAGQMIEGRAGMTWLLWRWISFGAWMKRFSIHAAWPDPIQN